VWPCRARIKLLASAETIAERLPSWIGLVEPIDERSCVLETGAPTFESLAMHLSLLAVDFEVTEPDELVEQVRRLADRYRRAAADQ
jgi:predicted DNA-binding transcriptional regulator YafY